MRYTLEQLDLKCKNRANGYRAEILAASIQVENDYEIEGTVFETLEKKWRPPSLAAMIGNLAQAAAEAARAGFDVRNGQETEAALGVCASCDQLIENGFRCGLCGCNLDLKVKLRSWHCPINKW